MPSHKLVIYSAILFSLLLSACAQGSTDTGMASKPTEAMPVETSMATPIDAMPDKPMETGMPKPTEDMMASPTEAMMDQSAEATMAPPTDAMMGKPTDAMLATPTGAMMDKPMENGMAIPAEGMMAEPTAMAGYTTPMPEAMADQPGAVMADAPAWFSSPLTDVKTGESFTMNDFKGKVILVEPMAQWCLTCLQQQNEIVGLHETLGMQADLVSIALNIDPHENADMLKMYTAKHGFDWIYAVTPAEVPAELSKLYGAQVINPPSAPLLVIDRKGQVHLLPFGVKSAADLYNALQPFLSAGM